MQNRCSVILDTEVAFFNMIHLFTHQQRLIQGEENINTNMVYIALTVVLKMMYNRPSTVRENKDMNINQKNQTIPIQRRCLRIFTSANKTHHRLVVPTCTVQKGWWFHSLQTPLPPISSLQMESSFKSHSGCNLCIGNE